MLWIYLLPGPLKPIRLYVPIWCTRQGPRDAPRGGEPCSTIVRPARSTQYPIHSSSILLLGSSSYCASGLLAVLGAWFQVGLEEADFTVRDLRTSLPYSVSLTSHVGSDWVREAGGLNKAESTAARMGAAASNGTGGVRNPASYRTPSLSY